MRRISPSSKRRGALALAPVLVLGLTAGCALHRRYDRVRLSRQELRGLSDRAVTAGAAGVMVNRTQSIGLVLQNTLQVTDGGATRTVVPFLQGPDHGPIVSLDVNGQQVTALVDTGSTRSMIDHRAARRCGVTPILRDDLPRGVPGRHNMISAEAQGLGGHVERFLAVADWMRVGDVVLRRVPLWIPDDLNGVTGTARVKGLTIDAVIGYDVLSAFKHVRFDHGAGLLALDLEREYLPSPQALRATTPMNTRIGIPIIAASLSGERSFLAVVDTGGAFGLWIPRLLAGRLKLAEFERDVRGTQDVNGVEATDGLHVGSGVAGLTAFKPVGDVAMSIGELQLARVPAVVSLVHFADRDPPFAFLGNDVLEHHVVTLDYAKQQVYFESPEATPIEGRELARK